MAEKECKHERVKCLCCGEEGTPGELMLRRKRGPRSEKGAAQSREAAQKRRVEITFAEAAGILASEEGEGTVTYRGHTFTRADLAASSFAAKKGGGKFGVNLSGAKRYIRSVLDNLEQPES